MVRTYSVRHFCVNLKYVLNVLLRKPAFLLRLVSNYLRALLSPDRPPLRFVDVALTYKCNMKCSHCSATDLARAGEKILTVEEYGKIAEKLIRAGLLVVNFTGGEPLLRKDFGEIIRTFKPYKVLVAVQTNALLLNEEKLYELRRLGVDSINVSIDGSDACTHDGFRNSPGAFEKALKVIETARKIGFNVGISYCLTHENLHSLDRTKIVEISKKFKTSLNYNLASPVGFWRGKYDNLITEADREDLLRVLEEYPQSKTDFETNYFKKGCGAIKEKLYITAYGEVMPCPFIQVCFGNLLADNVEDIKRRAFSYSYFSGYSPKCLAAEDMDFIKNTICYSPESEHLRMPIAHNNAFFNREQALGNVAGEVFR